MNLTNEQRKQLTEYIGECWHEYKLYPIGECGPPFGYCTKPDCVADFYGGPEGGRRIIEEGRLSRRRTFLTWLDLGAVMEKMVERGDWDDFYWWVEDVWRTERFDKEDNRFRSDSGFAYWLMRPTDEHGDPHFCKLAAEYLVSLDK